MNMPAPEKKIEEYIRNSLEGGRLPCAKAFQIARDLNLPKHRIGEACNRLGIKISRCQLGCFD